MSPSLDSEVGERRTRRGATIVVLAIVVLLLLACCWVSFRPLPDPGDGSPGTESGSGRTPSTAPVVIGDVRVESLPDVDVGRKGEAWLVSFSLASGRDRPFAAELASLDVDGVRIPPLRTDAHASRISRAIVPDALDAGMSHGVSLAFAVPKASVEATLCVVFHDMGPSERIEVPVSMGAE